MVYEYVSGFTYSVPADVAGNELSRIQSAYGEITKEIVLEESRSKEAPLHPIFEWDDTKAAEKYRLHQAGCIIRAVVVRTEEEPKKTVRAFVNIGGNNEGRFIDVKTALAQDETRDTVLSRAFAELEAFRKKYNNLSELSGVLSAIDEFLEEVGE